MAMAQCLHATPSSPVGGLSRLSSRAWRGAFREQLEFNSTRVSYIRRVSRLPKIVRSAMDVPMSGKGSSNNEEYAQPAVFPRIGVRDPFKLLGISREASEEEVREAHKYLVSQYSDHDKSKQAIEAAYDKIIMDSLKDRRKTKTIKSSPKKVAELPPWLQALTKGFGVPTSKVILPRAAVFVLIAVWSVLNPGVGGPAFQVAISLAACIYFLNDKMKSLGKAFAIGFGALVVGWVSGTFLVPVLLSYILPSSWSLELSTSLFSYIVLWSACTFMK